MTMIPAEFESFSAPKLRVVLETDDRRARRSYRKLRRLLRTVLSLEMQNMAQIEELTAAVDALLGGVNELIAEVRAEHTDAQALADITDRLEAAGDAVRSTLTDTADAPPAESPPVEEPPADPTDPGPSDADAPPASASPTAAPADAPVVEDGAGAGLGQKLRPV